MSEDGDRQNREPPQPAIILVRPQLADNIGATARAMLNFGLTELRLVAPRDGWPNSRAAAMASGADRVLDEARLFDTVEDAVADLHHVYATTARPRDMLKPVATAAGAAAEMRRDADAAGVLFGPERAGLNNDDVVLADTILTVPLNPDFSSLNLAQAVLLVAYEWHKAGDATPGREVAMGRTRPANKHELGQLFSHLEDELDAAGFFAPVMAKRPSMIRNLRNMLHRANFTEQDVRTLRGVIKALVRGKSRLE